ncbi:MAG TPA: 1-deoxy-D-xylulose-5-phosphate reductoisomerase [Hyphomicrobiales bacterium]|nr:1-deoxy-D-xylulose-5-phosphate reductoisomerase [Hyphomicrobiales bacterium]
MVGAPPGGGADFLARAIGTEWAQKRGKTIVVENVTANRNAADLAAEAIALGARRAVVADPAAYGELKERLAGTGIEAAAGADALVDVAAEDVDLVVAGIIGAAGLPPAMAAIEAGNAIALANKESLVCAGGLFMERARARQATVLPVDSEHNAIFQVFEADRADRIEKVILTASGGPFRTFSRERMASVTPAEALNHPNWKMGAKITVDSSTLMNKGFEVIEAYHLFPIEADQLDVLVHPQSIVHGLVAYSDGSVLAQLGSPDMRTPISYCLNWPARGPAPSARLDLAAIGQLTFEAPDMERFPALGLALAALRRGTAATNVLNAANEIAVAAFLAGRLPYFGIPALCEATLSALEGEGVPAELASLADVLALDARARAVAGGLLAGIAAATGAG